MEKVKHTEQDGPQRKPLNPWVLCSYCGIKMVPYSIGKKVIEGLGIEDDVKDTAGLALTYREIPAVLFDDLRSDEEQRYTVLHEISHVLLGHVSLWNPRTGHGDNHDAFETEANIFASVILALDTYEGFKQWNKQRCQ